MAVEAGKFRIGKIGIETPRPFGRSFLKILELSNMSLATSGDYRNFFRRSGVKYSHTIDYRTGRPVTGRVASVTVLDPFSCMNADAWATALMALGGKKGMELAEKLGLMAYFIIRNEGKNFKVLGTTEFRRKFN